MGWLNVIEAHKNLGIAMPVNMRFCFEGMEENGSEGLDECIQEEVKKGKEGWFDGVDCVCIVRAFLLVYAMERCINICGNRATTTG